MLSFSVAGKSPLILARRGRRLPRRLPNFFSTRTGRRAGRWLPTSRSCSASTSRAAPPALEVDRSRLVKKRLKTLVSDIRKTLLDRPRIGYTGLGASGQGVTVRSAIRDADKRRCSAASRSATLSSSLLGGGTRQRVRPRPSATTARPLHLSDAGLEAAPARHRRRSRSRSSTAASTQSARPSRASSAQGDDRILVEAPGLGDPARLKALVGQTAQLTFHMAAADARPIRQTPPQPKPGTVHVPPSQGDLPVADWSTMSR